jgi:tetratricopeptide (TPR) repeat protein
VGAQTDRPPPLPEQLVRRATTLVAGGRLADAGKLFEQAVALHRKAHRREDESRCLTLLAQCCRLMGDTQGAWEAVGRARRLAPVPSKAAVEAAAEYAEVALVHGDLEGAVAAISDALDHRRQLGIAENGTDARLERQRGVVNGALGHAADAATDMDRAARAFERIGDGTSARRVLVEKATLLQQAGSIDAYEAAARDARAAVVRADDQALGAELDLLDGAAAVIAGRLDDAEALTRTARDKALASVQPTTYVGACVALSEIADIRGDPVGAYEALAVGWATLGDLVGRDAAGTVFRPRLEELEQRWGVEAFARTREAYEDRRRRELGVE